MGNYNDTNGRNDPYSYRVDATAMLIGMLDMDGSRVGIVPFSGAPGRPVPIVELTDITNSEARTQLITKIYSQYPGKTDPNTNIGSALMKANQMLLNRQDAENRPMIVLMTDGQNSISGAINLQESLRWSDGRIVNEGQSPYNTEKADIVTREAYECAKANKIPVYTVSLGFEPTVVATGSGISLQDISLGTCGLESLRVARNNAQDLPGFFAQVLANQIGSSVQLTARPEAVAGQANLYEVKIPILNENILETNVILPTKLNRAKSGSFSDIEAESIELQDSTGIRKNASDGISIYRGFDRAHFSMIKIREPKNPGMWTIRFRSATNPSDVSFNILYKYNIKYNVDLRSVGGSSEHYKTDTLKLTGRFVDENGRYSTDNALYQDHTGEAGYEDWMTIRSNWALYRADSENSITGAPLKEGVLTANTVQNQFEATVNLADDIVYPAGDYILAVSASGAGLDRRVEIPLQLKNHEPIAAEYTETIEVNSTEEGKESTWTVEGTSGQLKKSVSDIVRDQDGDPVQYDLRPVDDAQSVALFTLNQETGIISYQTIMSGEKIKSGTARYELFYNDQDGGMGSVPVVLKIRSDVDAMLDAYDLEVDIEGNNVSGSADEYLKNTQLAVYARLKDKENGAYADSELLETLKRKIQIISSTGTNLAGDGTMTTNEDRLEFTVPSTGNQKDRWNVIVEVEPFDVISKTISIPNHAAPVAVADETVTIQCSGDKVPGFLSSLIGTDTPEDDESRVVNIKGLFTDDDGETATLIYSKPVFVIPGTQEETAGSVIYTTGDDTEYNIHVSGEETAPFRYTTTSKMVITATDGDGETAEYVRTINIEDLYNKLITYVLMVLAAIVILVILYLIIHQIRKPRFPKLNMTIREEPSYYESGSEPLSPVKTPTNLNAIGVDGEMAAKHNISMELLQNIIVRPVRSTTSVGVCCKKAVSGHEVMLNDVQMKPKKKYTWSLDQELSVRSVNGEGLVAVKLEDRREDANIDPTAEFGSADEWDTVVQEQGAKAASRKHSRKVEHKQASIEQETTSTNDDFDF